MTPSDGTDDGSATPKASSRRELLSGIATAGTAAGLSGYSGLVEASDYAQATPTGLGIAGQEYLQLPAFDVAEIPYDETEAISYLTVHGRYADHEPPEQFEVPDPPARTIGVMSMPSPERVGEEVDPLVAQPFEELLVEERGREFLAQTGAVPTPEFDWERELRQIGTAEIELFGEGAEARSFLGVAAGEWPTTTVLANLVRIPYEGDVVVVGEFVRRRTPPEPLEVEGECIDELCQFMEPMQVDMWRRYQEVIRHSVRCSEVPTGGGDFVKVCGGGTDPEDEPDPKFGVSDVRFVQQVDDTVVKPPKGSAIYVEPNPDLVEGENTTVVFEFDRLENLDQMDEDLEITLYRGHTDPGSSRSFEHTDSFEIPLDQLEKIEGDKEDTISVLHQLANDGDPNNDPPVFEADASPLAVITASNVLRFDFWERISEHPDDVVDLDPLKVGFVRLEDDENGDRYGQRTNGKPRDYRRSVESATSYLQKVFPGDVVTFEYLDMPFHGGYPRTGWFIDNCEGKCVVYKDLKHAENFLQRVATDSSYPHHNRGFPDGGILRLDGRDYSTMVDEIRSGGFDVVVAIVPGIAPGNSDASDYYSHWGLSNVGGLSPWDSESAVSVTGAKDSGDDQRISLATAHEIGHRFQQDYWEPSEDAPMARRSDPDSGTYIAPGPGDRIDPIHARDQETTDASGDDDPEGVVSLGYDLERGFDNVRRFENPEGSFHTEGPKKGTDTVDRLNSYMTGTTGDSAQAWADARIHQQLIDSRWNPTDTSGSGTVKYMLSAIGGFDGEGEIRYGEVTAMPGVEEYADVEDAPVVVELLDPHDEVLASTRVPAETGLCAYGSDDAEPLELISFSLPFAAEGVQIRSTAEERSTTMNPIVRSVRDAVRRVPAAGLTADPEEVREYVGEPLEEVAALMAEHGYDEATAVMDGPVRERIHEGVREYEAALNEPTLEGLHGLVDEMVYRLEAAAEAAQ